MSDSSDMDLLECLRKPPYKFRRRVLYTLQKMMYWSGLAAAYNKLHPSGGAILLMYHSVPGPQSAGWIDPQVSHSPEVFEEQMRFLAQHRNVISYGALINALEQSQTPEPASVVLSFDDGYLDTLEIVAPILARYNLPVILFLPTSYISRAENQTVDRLYTMFRTRTQHTYQPIDTAAPPLHLKSEKEIITAYQWILKRLIGAMPEEREDILANVERQLAPSQKPPRLIMTWSDVRQLVKKYPNFDIGVHSAEHLDLAAHSVDVARAEMERCVQDVERELGRRPEHFSFPYNRFNKETLALARELGFRSAVASALNPLITAETDPYAVPRMDAPRSLSLLRFWTSGAYPGLSHTLVGRI